MTDQPTLDIDDRFFQNVQEIMARSRQEAPVRRVSGHGGTAWLVTRFDDARRVLSGPGFTVSPTMARTVVDPESPLAGELAAQLSDPMRARYLFSSLLYLDPPDHTRVRRIVSKAFTPANVARLRPRIEAICDEVIGRMPASGTVDLMMDFSLYIPLTAISEQLGVPVADRRKFFDWSLVINGVPDPDRFSTAMREITDYLAGLIEIRRSAPGDDLLSLMIVARDEEDRLSDEELIALALLILLAGHDTTVTLISNSVLALLQTPAALGAVRADPGLLSGAVEELVRFHTPVNVTIPRYTLEPVTLGGVEIPAGEKVLVSVLSANQDERQFPDAGTLDPHRRTPHLGFGHGIHYCLGAPLARMETEIALEKLFARYPGLRLAVDPKELVYRRSTLFHSLDALPVVLA